MKTCVLYGPKDLRIEERPVSEPQPGFVRLRMGGVGICGSDLHYYHIGRVGNAVVREPMILGHELSGVVDAIGPGLSGLVPGQKVIINPTDECGTCGYCRSGHQNLCPDLRYYGSAARTPHVQGIMVEYPMVQARQCVAVSDAMPLDQAACVEPLAIALHAVARAGNLLGKRVFVSGGPGRVIGLLHALNDYEMNIEVACMFWPHFWSRKDLAHLLEDHGLKVGTFILSPGLDDLEWAATHFDFDVWMGGYQEQHTCKRHGIPFVPITVYTVTHVGYEGAVNLGNKMLMAMDGHSFVENCFTANEIEGYICN